MIAARHSRVLTPHLRVGALAISWLCTSCRRTFYLTPAEIERSPERLERVVHEFYRHNCERQGLLLPFRRVWWMRNAARRLRRPSQYGT